MAHNKADSNSMPLLECNDTACDGTKNEQSVSKPIEIYSFIDPLCPECWGLEPILKKLQTLYGNYISIVYFIGRKLSTVNCCKNNQIGQLKEHIELAKQWEKTASRSGMSCDGDLWLENPISSPLAASLAIKAAEFQGRKAAARFLRKIREFLFLTKQNISEKSVLLECAEMANLDVNEFEKDLHSERALKAYQCDLKICSEMDVQEYPSLVFFSKNVEEAGIKVTGMYSFDVYLDIIAEVLNEQPIKTEPPSLEDFLKKYHFVATKEISVVYDLSTECVENEMKKLVLKQIAERVPVKYGTFWRYKE